MLAWASVLPHNASFTHLTAARLYGLWLPPLPDHVPVFVQLPRQAPRPVWPGLRVLRTTTVEAPVTLTGIRVAGITDTLLALCRDVSDLDALVILDAALHTGLIGADRLASHIPLRRNGTPRLRRALAAADRRSESPWETLLRESHRAVGAAVTPQFVVRDSQEAFVARGDLRLDGVRVLHEYDGSHHLEVSRQRDDLRRGRRLVEAGWVRRGYTSHDLLYRATGVLRDIDLSLDRPHEPSRIHGWHEELRHHFCDRSSPTRQLLHPQLPSGTSLSA